MEIQKLGQNLTNILFKTIIKKRQFGVIPLFRLVFKVDICHDELVNAINLPGDQQQSDQMITAILSYTTYVRKESRGEEMLQVARVMIAELVTAAMLQTKQKLVNLFLERFSFEGGVINVPFLLQKSCLWYKTQWLQKLFEKGANLQEGDTNAVKTVLEKPHEQKGLKLEIIKLLVEKGAKVNFDIPHTTIVHEVMKRLQNENGNVAILDLVCSKFDFKSQSVCDREGKTPWHLALAGKRKIGIKICAVLRKYPINPSEKDKNGMRADSGKKEDDERVKILRKKESELKPKEREGAGGVKKKVKKNKAPSSHTDLSRKAEKEEDMKENTDAIIRYQKQMECTPEALKNLASAEETNCEVDCEDKNMEGEFLRETFSLTVMERSKESDIHDSDTSTGSKYLNMVEKAKENLRYYLDELHKHGDEYFYLAPKELVRKKPDIPFVDEDKKHKNACKSHQKPLPNEDVLEENSEHFDNGCWEIECSKKVMKILSGKKHKHIKRMFITKMNILSQGKFMGNIKHCKSVSSIKGIELYETRLNDKNRIIWQIVPQLHKLSEQADMKVTYTEIIRVWDIVFDHDEIHHHVKMIEESIKERDCHMPHKFKIKLRCTSQNKSNVHKGIREPRTFVPHEEGMENDSDEMSMFCPPVTQEKFSHTIAHLYKFSNCVVKLMLEDGDIEKAFPYKEWPTEHDIINLPYNQAVLLLGRSGTGKTMCCLYRMWNEFVNYWRKYASTVQEQSPSDTEDCGDDKEDRSDSPLSKDISSGDSHEEPTRLRHPESHCPLHQMFVTKNYVLCNRLRKQFLQFASSEECTEHHAQRKQDIFPNNISDIHDLTYPLFLTARQFYILLDYSLQDKNYFFDRDEEGNLTERIISNDYSHEDTLSDTVYDLDDSMDEERITLYPTSHKALKLRREVTASYFEMHIWPAIKKANDTMSPLLVWMEIKSFIKGSRQAIESENGYLTEEEYITVGQKAAPNFPSNRKRVYRLFKRYKKYVQNHPIDNLFDECDFIHHIFRRLPKANELEWNLHSIYIDEVQDFTQGELWLILCNCRDPNRLFLTGDTAQSIMSGVAFRFEDVKTLFYHLKLHVLEKVQVPEIKHLTINFRAHSGILRLASSVTGLLKRYFPYSFDHQNIPSEQGLLNGSKPVFLKSCSPIDLAVALAGRKQNTMIDFGANQAILVRTQEAKEMLPRELKAAIVLTIFESKGLEFDDVLLHNFFTDSKLTEEWRILASCSNPENKDKAESSSEGDCRRPHHLEFEEEKHKPLCSELKHLYTGITRSKTRLWFYETSDDHAPATWYWKDCGNLVEHKMVDEVSDLRDIESKSSPEDWRERGEEFMQHRLWEVAMKCFEKAKRPDKVRECDALMLYQDARNSKVKAEKFSRYIYAAKAFLECDRIEHAPRLLHHAAKCLSNGRQYEDAGWLFCKMKKFDDTIKCYIHSKKSDEVVRILEEQERYVEAVSFMAHHCEKFKALQLASKYIGQKYVLPSDIDDSMIKYGKKQVEIHSAKGYKERDRLLTIINVIAPALQVHYLEQVEAHTNAIKVLKELGKIDDAYELMQKQAMYKEAFDLAKQQKDIKKQNRAVLSAAKFQLSSCKSTRTEIPDLEVELKRMCLDGAPYVRGMTYLLLSKLSGDITYCREALNLFQEENNILGECEALVHLMPNTEKDMKFVENMVKVCIKVNTLCLTLKEGSVKRTASFSYTMEQVEEFYGFVKERDEYIFKLHQDVWKVMGKQQGNNRTHLQLRINKVCRAVSAHVQSNLKELTGNEVCRKVVQNELPKHCTQRPFNCSQSKLLKYTTAFSISLEMISHNDVHDNFEEWRRDFHTLIRHNVPILNAKCFDVMTRFPSVLKVLKDRLESMLPAPINELSLDDWMEIWMLSQILNKTDKVIQRIRPVPIHDIRSSDVHFFVPSAQIEGIEHKVSHFFQWIRCCQLLREAKARIAVKVLMNYIETIAYRRSLNGKVVCVSNMVMMLGISTMIFYAFHTLCSPQQTNNFLPQILMDLMDSFDQRNCRRKQDFKIFQACFKTFKTFAIPIVSLRSEAQAGIERVLRVFTGLYHEGFDVLHQAVKNEKHNNVIMCLTLGLTLLGNIANCRQYKPADLLPYQERVQRAIQPLIKHPDHQLKGICEQFQHCSSARDIFDLVVKLHEQFYESRKGTCLFNLQTLSHGLNLMPMDLARVPQNSVLPLNIKLPTAKTVNRNFSLKVDLPDTAQKSESETIQVERQPSNEEHFDEEVRMALVLENEQLVQLVERQTSVDKAIVDEKFCMACKTQLSSMNRNPNLSPLDEHIQSQEHKLKKEEYIKYTEMENVIAEKIKMWEREMNLLPQAGENESLVMGIQEHTHQVENILHNTKKTGEWKEGEGRLLSLQDQSDTIIKMLQDAKEKVPDATSEEEVKPKMLVTKAAAKDQSDEEVLSGMEDEEITPREAKRNIKRKKLK